MLSGIGVPDLFLASYHLWVGFGICVNSKNYMIVIFLQQLIRLLN